MNREDKIAVIGIALKFPGADTPESFWESIRNGADLISGDRSITTADGTDRIAAFGAVRGAYDFDRHLFGISKSEASRISQQERVMLLTAYHALEDAGIQPFHVTQKTGIVCAAGPDEYASADSGSDSLLEAFRGEALVTRIAYQFNLNGPCMTVDTTCASSLTAVHTASRILQFGEADVMLAGGVNLFLDDTGYLRIENVVSADGYLRAFDRNGTGFVPGNGCGAVVLKRLSDAKRDGDRIYAVIAGSAINNDGNRKVGFSASGVEGEFEAISAAAEQAGANADSIVAIEAHGTGTPLGDAVEIRAMGRYFANRKASPAVIGSVKSNIGHLNAAAGIASFIKAVLCVSHRYIAPSRNIEAVNTEFESVSGLIPCTEGRKIPDEMQHFFFGVNSVGMGGNNVHVMLENDENTVKKPDAANRICLLPFSGATEKTVKQYRKAIRHAQEQLTPQTAYTQSVCRFMFPHSDYVIFRTDTHALLAGTYHNMPDTLKLGVKMLIGQLPEMQKSDYLAILEQNPALQAVAAQYQLPDDLTDAERTELLLFAYLESLKQIGIPMNLASAGGQYPRAVIAAEQDFSPAAASALICDRTDPALPEPDLPAFDIAAPHTDRQDFTAYLLLGTAAFPVEALNQAFSKGFGLLTGSAADNETEQYLHAIGYLYSCGMNLDFKTLYRPQEQQLTDAFAYPFDLAYYNKLDDQPDFAAWKQIEKQLDGEQRTGRFSDYDGLEDTMRDLCVHAAAAVFRNAGIRYAQTYQADTLPEALGMLPEYKGFLYYLASLLADVGYATCTYDSIAISERICDLPEPERSFSAAKAKYPAFSAYLDLFRRCAENYIAVFRGEQKGNEILYPNGSFDMLYEVGKKTPEYEGDTTYTDILCKMLTKLCDTCRHINILEAGSGTGKLTWKILDLLKDRDITYYFTDIGSSFVAQGKMHAQEAGYENVCFHTFDISKSPAEQGIPENSFDVVIEYNVIQATESIAESLAQLKKCLRSGGLLMMAQTLSIHPTVNMIFGFAPGWWNYYADRTRRMRGIFPDAEQWQDALTDQGYDNVQIMTGGWNDKRTDIGIVIAEKPWSPAVMQTAQNMNVPDTEMQEQAGTAHADETESVQDCLIALIRDTVDAEGEITPDQDMFDLGVDSLSVLIIKSKLSSRYHVDLNVSDMYDCANIGELIEMVEQKIPQNRADQAPSSKQEQSAKSGILSAFDDLDG